VVVNVCDRVVLFAFVCFVAVFVRVDERRVIVLVHVVMGTVRKLAERSARVLVGDVPMVVRMDLGWVMVLVRLVADDFLLGLDGHTGTSWGRLIRST
jgi:hypothetical protein